MEAKRVFDYRWPWWMFAMLAGVTGYTFLLPIVGLWSDRSLESLLSAFACWLFSVVMATLVGTLLWSQVGRRLRMTITRSAVVFPVFGWRVRRGMVHYENVLDARVDLIRSVSRFRKVRFRLRSGRSTAIAGGLFANSQDAETALRLLLERLESFGVPVTTRYVSYNPFLPRQFTIRGLLILTTVVAVVLGLRLCVGDGKIGSGDALAVGVVAFYLAPLLLFFTRHKVLRLAGGGFLIGGIAE